MDRTASASMRIERGGARPVVVKVALDGSPAATRLRNEATILAAAQQPGVVTLVATEEHDGSIMLTTRYSGARTLADLGVPPIERAAAIVAALATTVADLHDASIRHGRITPDHVLVTADGRPVLCGFAGAAMGADHSPTTADDVDALGTLLRGLVSPAPDIDPGFSGARSRRGTRAVLQRRALLNLADQATADDPALRPSARQLAQTIRTIVPAATLAASAPPDDLALPGGVLDDATRPRMSRRSIVVGASAVITLIALLSTTKASSSPPAEMTSLPQAAIEHTAPTTTAPSPPPPSTSRTDPAPSPPRLRELASGAAGCAAIPGDPGDEAIAATGAPCPVHLAVGSGRLTIGDERFEIGLDDAAVAIGDFTCTGMTQAALVDLHSGGVYLFDDWPDGGVVIARPVGGVDDPRRALAEPAGSACHHLVVLDTFGIRHPINVGRGS